MYLEGKLVLFSHFDNEFLCDLRIKGEEETRTEKRLGCPSNTVTQR